MKPTRIKIKVNECVEIHDNLQVSQVTFILSDNKLQAVNIFCNLLLRLLHLGTQLNSTLSYSLRYVSSKMSSKVNVNLTNVYCSCPLLHTIHKWKANQLWLEKSSFGQDWSTNHIFSKKGYIQLCVGTVFQKNFFKEIKTHFFCRNPLIYSCIHDNLQVSQVTFILSDNKLQVINIVCNLLHQILI